MTLTEKKLLELVCDLLDKEGGKGLYDGNEAKIIFMANRAIEQAVEIIYTRGIDA